MNKTILSISAGALASAAVACASPSEPTRSLTIGDATIQSRLEGERVVTTISAARSDERMTIRYDRAKHEAELAPKYGQLKVIKNVDLETDLDDVNRRIGEPAADGLGFATDKRSTASTGDLKPSNNKPPPAACENPCVSACDSKYPDPMQNEACRFGCSTGCSR